MTDTISKNPDPGGRPRDFLGELLKTTTDKLMRKGIAPETARSVAEEIVESVRTTFSGTITYIPSGQRQRLARRDAEIRRRLAAGESRRTIRREFDLTDTRVRQIEAGDDQAPRKCV